MKKFLEMIITSLSGTMLLLFTILITVEEFLEGNHVYVYYAGVICTVLLIAIIYSVIDFFVNKGDK